MGIVKKNEALEAEVILPDPFTASHHETWRRIERESKANGVSGDEKVIAVMLAIIEGGSYFYNGERHLIKESGMDTPFEVAIWAALEVDGYIAGKFTALPKLLSLKEQSPPPTETEPPPLPNSD